jgi:hypothetical protein
MDFTARANSADRTFPMAKRRRGRGPRAGQVAGAVCRAAAGSCDVAETCTATASNPGGPHYQPSTGTLTTNQAWNANMGYGFTPFKVMTVTALGGYFNGTRTVSLYNRTTGAVLASVAVTSANGWAYAPIVLADANIDGACYRAGSSAEPCAASGLISGSSYGMADLKYLPAGPLYQPADGTLITDAAGDYITGYAFTPNKNITVTHLGGFYNGLKTVYLFRRSTGRGWAGSATASPAPTAGRRSSPASLPRSRRRAATNVPRSYSWLPGDVLKSANYSPQNAHALIRKTNAIRRYGHCYAPLTLTSTPSPSTSVYGTAISWTATATGGIPATTQFAVFHKRSGTTTWTPPLTSLNWQSSNVLTAHYFDYYPSGGIPSGTHFYAWSIDLPYATPGNDNRKGGGTGAIGDGTELVIP